MLVEGNLGDVQALGNLVDAELLLAVERLGDDGRAFGLLREAPSAERQSVADAIAASSPISWQHINLHGEFDFSDEALKDSLRFDLEALYAFNWEQAPGASD